MSPSGRSSSRRSTRCIGKDGAGSERLAGLIGDEVIEKPELDAAQAQAFDREIENAPRTSRVVTRVATMSAPG